MNSSLLMIIISAGVLLSYWYTYLARRFHFPAVVLLLITGLLARFATHSLHNTLQLPPQLLPVLGTAGLVLIVLEGALDLRLHAEQGRFLLRTFAAAFLGVACTTLAIAMAMLLLFDLGLWQALLAATPFGVISSSVAIPSAESLHHRDREFVIYESAWSDILGVMLFNFLLVHNRSGHGATLHLVAGALAVLLVGTAIALAVYWLVGHLQGHVKFLPLLFALILVYCGAEAIHLSPLLIVLILGLVLNNSHLLRRFHAFERLHSSHYEAELGRLKHLTAEATFLVRTYFFLLLGYVTGIEAFEDPRAWGYAVALVTGVLVLRWIVLLITNGRPTRPLLWVTPRGLITATLYFSTPAGLLSSSFPDATLILVIFISCLVMAFGLRLDRPAAHTANVQVGFTDDPARE